MRDMGLLLVLIVLVCFMVYSGFPAKKMSFHLGRICLVLF